MPKLDTSIGAGQSGLQSTLWGEILRIREAGSADAGELLAQLAAIYWRPVYKYIRIVWSKGNEEAKDLTQEFFATVFTLEFLARADPERGSFRTFLLTSLRNFLRDYQKYSNAEKRGGRHRVIPMDDAGLAFVPSRAATPEKEFLRTWAETVLSEALRELEHDLASRGRGKVFQAFRQYCLDSEPGEKLSYRALAEELRVTETDVRNYLAQARRELRVILLQKVGVYVRSAEEAEQELSALFED